MKDKTFKNFIKKLERLKTAQLAQKKEKLGNLLFGSDTKLILKAYSLEPGNFKKVYPQLLNKQTALNERLENLSKEPTTEGGAMAAKAARVMLSTQEKIVDELVEKYGKLYDIIFSDDIPSLTSLTDDQLLDFAFVTEVTKILYNKHDTYGYSSYGPLLQIFEQLEAKLENNPILQNDIHNFIEYLVSSAEKEAEMVQTFNADVSRKLQELEKIKINVPKIEEFDPLPPGASRLDSSVDAQMSSRTSRLDSSLATSTPEKKPTPKPTPKPTQKKDEKPKAPDGDSICLDGLFPEEKPQKPKEKAIKEL